MAAEICLKVMNSPSNHHTKLIAVGYQSLYKPMGKWLASNFFFKINNNVKLGVVLLACPNKISLAIATWLEDLNILAPILCNRPIDTGNHFPLQMVIGTSTGMPLYN